MNRDQVEGKWKQLTGYAGKHWADSGTMTFKMLHVLAHFTKWMSVPVLLIASMFSYAAARYEPLLETVVIVAAMGFAGQAVRSREYSWAAGLVAVVVAFSPLFLGMKLFLVMGLVCIAALAALVAAFRTQPLPVA